MSNLVLFYIILQIITLFIMVFHDWINIPPLTNIPELAKVNSKQRRLRNSIIFFVFTFIPLILTIIYRQSLPLWVLLINLAFYATTTYGTIYSWWIPYLFGSSEQHTYAFRQYEKTHHFLPKIGNNVIPNTLHVILHVFIWSCLIINIYLIFQKYI